MLLWLTGVTGRYAGCRRQLSCPGGDPVGAFWIAEAEPFAPRRYIAFRVASETQVDAFHAAAMAAGPCDNGAPGLCQQYHPHYCAAFVIDPDGYNIEAVFHGSGLTQGA